MSAGESAGESERPIARRQLQSIEGHSIDLVLYAPLQDPSIGDRWRCKTEIITSQGTTSFDNIGIDALQALALALTSLRHGVKELETIVSWMGIDGSGLPVVVQEIDEDFQCLMESLLSAELSRQDMMQKLARSRHEK